MVNSTWDVSCSEGGITWAPDLPPSEGYPLFIEMAQLHQRANVEEWREAARWVKYEEDIEEGGQRWSKPFVPCVPLKAFNSLRSLMENIHVDLSFDCANNDRACSTLVDTWLSAGLISDGDRMKVLQTLLRPHVHLYEVSKSIFPPFFKTKAKKKPQRRVSRGGEIQRRYSITSMVHRQPEKDDSQKNIQFLRKIPRNAECANVMVGEVSGLKQPLGAFLRLQEARVLGNLTEVPLPTRFLFVLLSPAGSRVVGELFEIGRTLGTLLTDPGFKEKAYLAQSRPELLTALDKFIGGTSVLPPATWDPTNRLQPPTLGAKGGEGSDGGSLDEHDDGLKRSGKFFGGFVADIKRKLPWYWADFKDALSLQCLATWLFLYFACLTPMITFGGLMGLATHNAMGTMETMIAGCFCGIGFALFSGQPLLILGSTGPVLVFEKILVHFSESHELDYLEFRLWVGIWIAGTLLVLVATDASSLVAYITRFTEDNFATLIACIFMVEAVKNVMLIRHVRPMVSNHTRSLGSGEDPLDYVPGDTAEDNFTAWNWDYEVYHEEENVSKVDALVESLVVETGQSVFLMSLLLFAGTFIVSYMLKEFRVSPFFPTVVRYIVSDFAVIIAIAFMTFVDYKASIPTPKLAVPERFAPTSPDRGWLISPFGKNPFWSVFAASIPALLATILIFMDQQITAVIINRKDHKLKKGSGYHLDLFVLATLITGCSILGLPWFVAATVESLTNLNSLKMESESAAPGEKPSFVGVREQRVSNVLVFSTVGVSVLMTPLLRHVPMPVLYGVFLYMGFSALMRMELFQRILLFFMPVKYQPDHRYLRKVPLRRVHVFTLIQVLCLALLWVIKSWKPTAILFPLMLVVMMVVRKGLDFIFSEQELSALDDLLPQSKGKSKKGSAVDKRRKSSAKPEIDLNGCAYKAVSTIPDV